MANKNLFKSTSGGIVPDADTFNEAGGKAYKLNDKAALAQLVVTGTFNDTFYADAKTQLDNVLKLTEKVPAKFIAQTAVYARQNAYMKDSPAVLCAVLAVRDVELLKTIFNDVIDNGKMLKNFVQIVRSGVTGRKSLGTAVKKLVQNWLVSRSDYQLFRDIVGNDPSLADVIKMVHPTPKNKKQETMFGYICGNVDVKINTRTGEVTSVTRNYRGKAHNIQLRYVPDIVVEYETYKQLRLAGKDAGTAPNVPFQMLSALNMGKEEWTEMANNGQWMFTRMNLNNFQKYGVFDDPKMVTKIAKRLADPEEVKKARAFPYQLLTAYKNTSGVPSKVQNALQDALEAAVENVPSIEGKKIYVCVDTSGSMGCSVTGGYGFSRAPASQTSCVDVAGLIAAAILRKNEDAEVIPFDTRVHAIRLNSRDSVMTNANKLARHGGGTDCSSAIRHLNNKNAKGDLIIMVSDNESWRDRGWGRSTGTAAEFAKFKKRNPGAKMINIDIAPYNTTQVPESKHAFNIGGFSDHVFNIMEAYATGKLEKGYFVAEIEKVDVGNTSKTKKRVTGADLKRAARSRRRD
jgi:60 kDa SS-A/Ro ribonucleoprotein